MKRPDDHDHDYAVACDLQGRAVVLRFAHAEHGCESAETFLDWLGPRIGIALRNRDVITSFNGYGKNLDVVTMIVLTTNPMVQFIGPWKEHVERALAHEEKKAAAVAAATGGDPPRVIVAPGHAVKRVRR